MTQETLYREDFVGHFRLLGFATGAYLCSCRLCGKQFVGDKRALSCLDCAISAAEAKFTSANKRRNAICRWKFDKDDCYWHTSCGQDFVFNDGTPAENGVIFCFHCGKQASVR